jgi:hypothetical protein
MKYYVYEKFTDGTNYLRAVSDNREEVEVYIEEHKDSFNGTLEIREGD